MCTQCTSGYQFSSNNVCTLCNITGCTQCNSNNNCAKCSSGYTPLGSSSGLCALCNVANCAGCSSDNFCSSCNTPFSPSSSGQCICQLSSLPNCAVCSTNTSCASCNPGYQLYLNSQTNNYQCNQCNLQNCMTCQLDSSANIQCKTCMTGYMLSSTFQCVACSFPCMQCNTANTCSQCQTPFYFSMPNNGSCVANTINNCISYNPNNITVCTGCATGYTLNSSNLCAFNCPNNCNNCSNNNTCTSCNTGYYVNSNNQCSQCTGTACNQCTAANPNLCTSCINGYYFTVTSAPGGTCTACPTFCSACTSAALCTALAQPTSQAIVQVNGQSVLAQCQSNCMTCSVLNPQLCTQCMWGFYLNSNNICMPCSSSNCKTCNGNFSACSSCFTSYILSNNTCVACNSNCLTCSSATALSTCTSCYPGFYLGSGATCQQCSANCINCATGSVCSQCIAGYVLAIASGGSISCVKCTVGCSQCAEFSPSVCLSCTNGYYLNAQGTCTQCVANCQQCSNIGCTSCASGYFLNSALACSANCVFPCSTCSNINPTKCLSCFAGYSINQLSNTCQNVSSCLPAPCSVCPSGYSLYAGLCKPCSIANCGACTQSTTACDSCSLGYYLTTSATPTCTLCPSQCATCLSSTGCLTCSIGYTIMQNAIASSNGYQCIQCMPPCLTCLGSSIYCTSCLSGYQLMGSSCLQTFTFPFNVTLNTQMTIFNTNYLGFFNYLVSSLGSSSPNTNSINIISITTGSVIVNGQAAPSAPTGTQQANNQFNTFANALAQNNNIAGMSVSSSTVTVTGGSIDFDTGSNHLAVILGVCIPVGVIRK